MADSTHWGACWHVHQECAIARIEALQRVLLEMYATLDHSAEAKGETCWSCFLQGEANELFVGYEPAQFDGTGA